MNLYELTADLQKLADMMDDPEIDQEVLKDTMEGVEGEFDDKCQNYAIVINQKQSEVDQLKAEEKRLAERRKVIENNITRMKGAVMTAMMAANKRKAGGTLFTVSIQKNGGKAPVVLDVAPEDVPIWGQKVVMSPDIEVIREQIEAGTCDFAHLGERGESLRIR